MPTRVRCPYTARVLAVIKNRPGTWDSLRVGAFADGELLTTYRRNYNRLYNTFHPFLLEGRWFALYSRDYTCTRIMSLPDGKDIGGERRRANGFCPVDYYVPYRDRKLLENCPEMAGKFGFVAGCIWGDDTSWKIQYLDLSRASQGILKRDERFGRPILPYRLKRLSDAIYLGFYDPGRPLIDIAVERLFDGDGTPQDEWSR